MIDRIIRDYTHRRNKDVSVLARMTRNKVGLESNRAMYNKIVSNLRNRIPQYDEYIEYLLSIKGKCE